MSEQTIRPFTSAAFNQYLAEHKLMGTRCPTCQQIYLPPRAICPACHGEELAWVEVSGQGKVAAFTSIYVGPSAMIAQGYDRNNPYVAGVIELTEGAKISARVVGLDAKTPDVRWIGLPVTVEFLDHGEGEAKTTTLAFRAA